ncbi:DNA alkylation repair protein [Alterileibacterium massiliense]|uniref:DNA alkylation repair protein n=1 Tax=Alterileibacterium massiliense TaxID=1870997 RepID=UPI002F4002BF
MMSIRDKLIELEDKEYADFQSKLVPNISRERIIGVRIPKARKLVKEIREEEAKEFLADLPHYYYDENILHGLLISEIKDYTSTIKELDRFLPFIDNWAVCDIISPKVFRKKENRKELISDIRRWSKSKPTYTARFGLEMLMSHFLGDDFKKEYLEIPLSIKTDEYYLQMMIAWFFATALSKQWEETIKVLTEKKLDTFIQNKTIQKARESRRITREQKEFLKRLKK